MVRLLFLALILLTWYLAAMYHLVSLLALAAAELLLLFCIFAVSRYLKRRIRPRFAGQVLAAGKRRKIACPFVVENTGRLPAGKLRMRFRSACWDGRSEKSSFLYTDAGSGEEEAPEFYINAPWCGMLTISIDSVRVYDYLSLFPAKVPAFGSIKVAVLPEERALDIRFAGDFSARAGFEEEQRPVFGSGSGEIRDLREYTAGDPYRLIHWNQTARTDVLWVKEQEPEQEPSVPLYLDLRSEKQRSVQELDAFFEVLSALAEGLLRRGLSVRVRWEDRDGAPAEALVRDGEERRGMLMRLYESGPFSVRKKAFGGEGTPAGDGRGLCLNLDLSVFWNGNELRRFSAQNWSEELERTTLVL